MNRWRTPWLAPLLAERRLCIVLLAAAAAIAIGSALGFSLWQCPFHSATGLPCPGCGLTRGMVALAHGDWRKATTFHPFTPFFALGWFFILIVTLLPGKARALLLENLAAVERRTGAMTILLLLFLGYGLTRMVLYCCH